jgi:hypothetical protein
MDEDGNCPDVIELLNISADPKIDQKLYEDMICKFYSTVHHHIYMGVKNLRLNKA